MSSRILDSNASRFDSFFYIVWPIWRYQLIMKDKWDFVGLLFRSSSLNPLKVKQVVLFLDRVTWSFRVLLNAVVSIKWLHVTMVSIQDWDFISVPEFGDAFLINLGFFTEVNKVFLSLRGFQGSMFYVLRWHRGREFQKLTSSNRNSKLFLEFNDSFIVLETADPGNIPLSPFLRVLISNRSWTNRIQVWHSLLGITQMRLTSFISL